MINQLTDFTKDGQKITLNYENGPMILTVLTPEIMRFFQDRGNASNSYAIEGDKEIKTDFTVKNKGDHIEIATAKLIVKAYDDEKLTSLMNKAIHWS